LGLLKLNRERYEEVRQGLYSKKKGRGKTGRKRAAKKLPAGLFDSDTDD